MSDDAITCNQMVTIHYTLSDDSGERIDESQPEEPLSYVHGHGQIIPGLEKALDGAGVGDKVSVTVPPDEGYGPHLPERVVDVPRANFEFDPEVGGIVQAEMPDGRQTFLQIQAVSPDSVTLDGNHPLAGKTLVFDVVVDGLRPATDEELQELTTHEHHEGCSHGCGGEHTH